MTRPLKGGVIVDLRGAAEMLRGLVGIVQPHGRRRPRVVATVPGFLGAVQRRAVVEACRAGLREGRLIAAPVAAALGSGLPVQGADRIAMVLDFGGGSCEVAMISMGGVVPRGRSRSVACDFDQRIVAPSQAQAHQVLIGDQTAERIKVQIGSASGTRRTCRSRSSPAI